MTEGPILPILAHTTSDKAPDEKMQRSIRAIESECNFILDEIATERVSGTPLDELESLINRLKVSLKAIEQYTEDLDHWFTHLDKKTVAE